MALDVGLDIDSTPRCKFRVVLNFYVGLHKHLKTVETLLDVCEPHLDQDGVTMSLEFVLYPISSFPLSDMHLLS